MKVIKTLLQLSVIALLLLVLTKSYLANRGKFKDDDDDGPKSGPVLNSKHLATQSVYLSSIKIKNAGIKTEELENLNGLVSQIPNSAVVWKGGKAFVYSSQKSGEFTSVSATYQDNQGWSAMIPNSGSIVVRGAGVLLSQQFHTQVKAGDDD